jgi:hypothetical protein
MCLGIIELNSSDAPQVVEIPRDLVVRGICRELSLCDKEVGLRDIGRRYVVSKEQCCHGGLRVLVLPEHCTSKSGEELSADRDDGRLLRRRLGIQLLVEQGEVEVCFGGKGIQCSAVQFSDLVDKLRGKLGSFFVLLLVVKIYLRKTLTETVVGSYRIYHDFAERTWIKMAM